MKAATMNLQYNLKSIMHTARTIRATQSLTWSDALKSAWSEAKQKIAALKAALIAVTEVTPEITPPKFKTVINTSIESKLHPLPDKPNFKYADTDSRFIEQRNHEINIFQITFNPAKSEDEYMQVHNAFFETLDKIPTLENKIKFLCYNIHNAIDTPTHYVYHYIKEDLVYFNVVTISKSTKVRIFKGFQYDYKANIITYRQDQFQSLKGLLVELFVKAGIETTLKDWQKGKYDRTYIKSKTLDLGFWDNKTNTYTPGKEDLFLYLKNKLE